ncbi:MAG TPA: GNAT family N-acetyltransferase [Candidatus Angelobacter sp.]|nr:GNAT family N-acetyltransferase [Candidatus Angelobacter sp.]
MSMTPTLETSRLILRPLELSDAEQTQRLFPHWEVVRYIRSAVPWPYPPDGAYTYYRDIALPAVARGDEWAWTLRLKSAPDQLIGAISLFHSETDNRGFWLGLPWQRQGLMTEACNAVTDYWFEVLKFPMLRVPKAIANVGSRRISEKQGMRVIAREDRDYVSGRLPSEIWEITAEEWRQHKRLT